MKTQTKKQTKKAEQVNRFNILQEHVKELAKVKTAAADKSTFSNRVASDVLKIRLEGTKEENEKTDVFFAKGGPGYAYKGLASQAAKVKRALQALKENDCIRAGDHMASMAVVKATPYGQEMPFKVNAIYRFINVKEKTALEAVQAEQSREDKALALYCEENGFDVKTFVKENTIADVAKAIATMLPKVAEAEKAEQAQAREAELIDMARRVIDDLATLKAEAPTLFLQTMQVLNGKQAPRKKAA